MPDMDPTPSGDYFENERQRYGSGAPIFEHSSWKFYLPHVWNEEPKRWGDIYLMPDEYDYKGDSIWLTINAVVIPPDLAEKVFESIRQHGNSSRDRKNYEARLDRYEGYLDRMAGADHLIDYGQQEMYVRAVNFTKEQMVEWAMLYLQSSGVEFPQMRETAIEEFSGTNQHVAMVEELPERIDQIRDLVLPPPELDEAMPPAEERPDSSGE